MSNTVTFTAARRRFGRAHDDHRTISKLGQAEMQGLGGFAFALLESNHVLDYGDLAAVERWCRGAGVLSLGETITL
ncbi:hypothetical protein G8O24_10330 [Bradyrhizobium sp. INPA01-394B]|uniref:Uncharacterized protein n=1 Tax=Bradyrhizobium campsiandrae TaxID=1729892 RepID=A0ABR7U125_9BRAD|nr:hypothetical protein [Bradyrhizobium campsiandrae]MBC9877736.1 hypothetical protein [Bradyrhizobium campsiandrae]MBC9977709.1 hypothetical protein [Bradyrhizobium campsiandrae]